MYYNKGLCGKKLRVIEHAVFRNYLNISQLWSNLGLVNTILDQTMADDRSAINRLTELDNRLVNLSRITGNPLTYQ